MSPVAALGLLPQLGLEFLLVLDPVVIDDTRQGAEDIDVISHASGELGVDTSARTNQAFFALSIAYMTNCQAFWSLAAAASLRPY
ncbi:MULTISPECIES: hypothetical protein [unclassified Bradyrhizobium]|uniref:hypothetical protein n=1 Tax=unclassified Bradyrhizobium TaxID=2631580 RepID=UPI0028E61E9F|nr:MULTISPECIES: hypothetical protein [unclassified Bradyrhizobium]